MMQPQKAEIGTDLRMAIMSPSGRAKLMEVLEEIPHTHRLEIIEGLSILILTLPHEIEVTDPPLEKARRLIRDICEVI